MKAIKRSRGFIDPISLGFLIAIAGTAAVLSFDKPSQDVASIDGSSIVEQAPVVAQQPVVPAAD
jgi:hypothetical protein